LAYGTCTYGWGPHRLTQQLQGGAWRRGSCWPALLLVAPASPARRAAPLRLLLLLLLLLLLSLLLLRCCCWLVLPLPAASADARCSATRGQKRQPLLVPCGSATTT
jgi:hypothetical protein